MCTLLVQYLGRFSIAPFSQHVGGVETNLLRRPAAAEALAGDLRSWQLLAGSSSPGNNNRLTRLPMHQCSKLIMSVHDVHVCCSSSIYSDIF